MVDRQVDGRTPVTTEEDLSSGYGWVHRTNARPIGRVEFRQVELEIGSSKRARVLKIRTLRRLVGDIAQTIVCVMEPWTFRNVNYVVTEERGKLEPFAIQLYLPYVTGTLRNLATTRRKEGLLGSEFSYDDMRTWLYEEGHIYSFAARRRDGLLWVKGVCVQGCELVRHSSAPFEVALDPDRCVLRGCNYLSLDGRSILREYRADEWGLVDGIAIPGVMSMLDCSSGDTTTLRLERAWYDRDIDEAIFESRMRRRTREYLDSL